MRVIRTKLLRIAWPICKYKLFFFLASMKMVQVVVDVVKVKRHNLRQTDSKSRIFSLHQSLKLRKDRKKMS